MSDAIDGLADRAASPNPFFRPGFLGPAAAALAPPSLRLATAWQGDRLVFFAPLAATAVPGVLRAFSHDYGPLGVPLVERDLAAEAGRALVEGLRAAGARALLLPDLPLADPIVAALRAGAVEAGAAAADSGVERRPILKGGAAPDCVPLDALVAKRRRKELARQRRRLADEGEVALLHVDHPAAIGAALEVFFRVEQSGWKGRNGTALADDPALRALAGGMVGAFSARGRVAVRLLVVGGTPVAALVELRDRALRIPWKIAFDEARASLSPGAQLMLAATEDWLVDPAVARVDPICRADNALLAHLWRDGEPYGATILAFGRAPAAEAALLRAALDAGQRLRRSPALRRLRDGLVSLRGALRRVP